MTIFVDFNINCPICEYLSYFEWSWPLQFEFIQEKSQMGVTKQNKITNFKISLKDFSIMPFIYFLLLKGWTLICRQPELLQRMDLINFVF